MAAFCFGQKPIDLDLAIDLTKKVSYGACGKVALACVKLCVDDVVLFPESETESTS